MTVQLNRIDSIHHPDVVPALRIYVEAFPPDEQMSVAYWVETLLSLPDDSKHLYSVVANGSGVAGLVYFEVSGAGPGRVATLWYLCTRADLRGTGIGGAVYQNLRQKAWDAGATALVYEVEKPDVAAQVSSNHADMARRRIAFYRRNGGRLLGGVRYVQQVDNGSAPVPMHVMIDSPEPMTAEVAFEYANLGLDNGVTPSGPLSLD